MNRRDDDDAQVDGDDQRGPSPFATSMRAQPWMRGGLPPWHMWGNTQQVTVPIETTGFARQGVTNQLVRIAYKRPESWHWLMSAKMISGPDNTPGFFSRILVHWELTVGLGRSAIQMQFELNSLTQTFAIPAFEDFEFRWGPVFPAFPRSAHIWSTQARAPSRFFDAETPQPAGDPVQQIVAQDLQLQVQIVGLTVPANVAAVGQNVVVEVAAMFAPKTHIRPDWLQLDVPPEAQFSGEEVQGR
jgi:hypothetical protein